jgi:hypothetical protein
MDETPEIEAFIADALQEAGMSGLCREGCFELAVDRLRREHPEIDAEKAWALVRSVDDKTSKRRQGAP